MMMMMMMMTIITRRKWFLEGVANVIIYTPADEAEKKKNRGFCFVDFDTHKNASVAKRKLAGGRFRVCIHSLERKKNKFDTINE